MRKLIPALLLFWSSLAFAEVVNVEFQFAPFTGDTKTAQEVTLVAGKARVFINNVLYAEETIEQDTRPVLFEERQIAPAVWVTASSAGPVIRKGKNTLRIEFEPEDAKAPYSAQFRWASVMDQATEEKSLGSYRGTNEADTGMEEQQLTGRIVFEREFMANFAADLPWHHYPAVTALEDRDKAALMALVKERGEAFKPKFEGLYKLLAGSKNINLAELRKARCLDAAYTAGVRVGVPAADQIEFRLTGNPEVVLTRKDGDLYAFDTRAFERIKKDEVQMCAGMVLGAAYPPHLVVIRAPAGAWEVVY